MAPGMTTGILHLEGILVPFLYEYPENIKRAMFGQNDWRARHIAHKASTVVSFVQSCLVCRLIITSLDCMRHYGIWWHTIAVRPLSTIDSAAMF